MGFPDGSLSSASPSLKLRPSYQSDLRTRPRAKRLEEQHADDPRALLVALLSGIAQRIGRPAYRGCPFLNLTTEFPDQNHPGRVVARDNKEEMRARLATIVAKLGAADPNRVASQLTLIINGAYAIGLIAKPADLRGDLVDAAQKLLA
jgi:hypothetical protein